MAQPGAVSRERFRYEGLSSGSPSLPVVNPRMFSASYQRYSAELFCAWREGFTQRHKEKHTKAPSRIFVSLYLPLCLCVKYRFRGGLPQCFQALAKRALAAGEHRRVAQGVRTRLRFAQLLDQIEE